MDIMDIAVKTLRQRLGASGASSASSASSEGSQDPDLIKSVVGKLIGSGDSLDLAGLVNWLQNSGLGKIAESWLGDGGNAGITAAQVREVLGAGDVAEAARELNTDENSLLDGLQALLPEMVDKSSRGGSLLDSVGGLGGLAKRFL